MSRELVELIPLSRLDEVVRLFDMLDHFIELGKDIKTGSFAHQNCFEVGKHTFRVSAYFKKVNGKDWQADVMLGGTGVNGVIRAAKIINKQFLKHISKSLQGEKVDLNDYIIETNDSIDDLPRGKGIFPVDNQFPFSQFRKVMENAIMKKLKKDKKNVKYHIAQNPIGYDFSWPMRYSP